MKTKIKICGLKTAEEALFCLEAGVDYLGFNFVSSSHRYITSERAKTIIRKLPENRAATVGVFRDEPLEKVRNIAVGLRLHFIQLHGDEDEAYCQKLFGFRLIKAISSNKAIYDFPAEFLMLDREIQGQGETINFHTAAYLKIKKPLFLAGGLTPNNVGEALVVKPYAVDVASGVETGGRKDKEKIRKFIKQVNQYE